MKIIYKTGDLLAAPETVIVHGCNSLGVMGSGVAKAIRDAYPKAYDYYRERYDYAGLSLGDVIWVPIWTNRIVINAITQERFGSKPGHVYVDYAAVEDAMRKIVQAPYWEGDFSIAMPKIGAGLGGGHWPTIEQIIEKTFTDIQPVVYTLD